LDINALNKKTYLKIIPLGSYECLIGMDCSEKNHVVPNYNNNSFTCLDEEGNLISIQGIPSAVTIKEISAR
jgi:hypothetical protein